MKLLITDDDDLICVEIEEVEKIATVPTQGGGVALSPEFRTMLCAYFVDGIVPKIQKQRPRAVVKHFPNYRIREQ